MINVRVIHLESGKELIGTVEYVTGGIFLEDKTNMEYKNNDEVIVIQCPYQENN